MSFTGSKISSRDPIALADALASNAILLVTITDQGNYKLPLTDIVGNYVKLQSDTQQLIESSLSIDTKSQNSNILLNTSLIDIGDIYGTSGIGVTANNQYIAILAENEWGNDGPTLFIGERGQSYSRLNKNGYYFYNMDGVGIDSYQYATNGTVYGNMTQRMQPEYQYFYWDLSFPNIYFKVESGSDGYGDIYMNSPTSSAYAQILLGSTDPQFYLGNLPLKTNTGIYGSGHQLGIEFTDDTKISFVKAPQTEIASLFSVNTTEVELKLGEYSNYDNVVYFMQPSRTSSGSDTLMYAYDARTNSYGTSEVQIRTDGFYNTVINQNSRVDLHWNHGGVESTTIPNNPQAWMRTQIQFDSYTTVSELRGSVDADNCYSELQLESDRSNDFVTLRAGYGSADTRLDLKGTLTRFSSVDSSRLLTYESVATPTKYFSVDLQYNQMNISGLEVWSNNGTTFLSPSLTGTPTAPTVASATDSSTTIATTAFVQNKISKPSDTVTTITTTGSITPTDGKIYKIVGTGITVTLATGGSGTCFIQNDTTAGNTNVIAFADVAGVATQVTLSTTASGIQTATFTKTTNGYMKL